MSHVRRVTVPSLAWLVFAFVRFLLTPEEVYIDSVEVWDYEDFLEEFGELVESDEPFYDEVAAEYEQDTSFDYTYDERDF